MKRLVLSALALCFAAVPAAYAQQQPQQQHHYRDRGHADHQFRRPPAHFADRAHSRPAAHRWARGHRLPYAYRVNVIRNYHRHHLRRPVRGEYWVRVGNEFLLINKATGAINAIMPVY